MDLVSFLGPPDFWIALLCFLVGWGLMDAIRNRRGGPKY